MTTKVRSPLTGIVLAISVKVGDAVSAGDELALLESMKMEFPVQAPAQGLVSEVLVATAQPVAEGDTLFRLE